MQSPARSRRRPTTPQLCPLATKTSGSSPIWCISATSDRSVRFKCTPICSPRSPTATVLAPGAALSVRRRRRRRIRLQPTSLHRRFRQRNDRSVRSLVACCRAPRSPMTAAIRKMRRRARRIPFTPSMCARRRCRAHLESVPSARAAASAANHRCAAGGAGRDRDLAISQYLTKNT
jgi:hypothetical protein